LGHIKSLSPYSSTRDYFLGGFSPLGDIIIGSANPTKGFFWKKKANCNHISKEKE
jgi:hypothetical protein